jgi:hypothetical protein
MKPFQDVTLKSEVYSYWLAKAGTDDMVFGFAGMTSVARPGQLLNTTKRAHLGYETDLTLTYDYTEDVQFNLLGGLFLPGNVFSSGVLGGASSMQKSNNAASEVIGSMKVTF